MAKITIEIDDSIIESALAEVMSEAASSGSGKGKGKDKPVKEKDDDAGNDDDYEPSEIKEMCEKYKKLTSAKDLKEVLSEYDVTTPAKAMKLEDDDLQDLGDDLQDAIEEAEEGGGEEEEEITVDAVKAAVQAYSKAEGKEAAQEILEEYNIKSVRSLGRLDQEDLEELYEQVVE